MSMTSNIHDGSSNGNYATICGAVCPTDPGVVCSLAVGHRGEHHKAYRGHKTQFRAHYIGRWDRPWAERGGVGDDEVAAAIASITGLVKQPDPPPEPESSPLVPSDTAAATRILTAKNKALRQENKTLREQLERAYADMAAIRDILDG